MTAGDDPPLLSALRELGDEHDRILARKGGAVRYQREAAWCDGCRAVVPVLRAVRLVDGWHADWTCAALASTGEHATPPVARLMAELAREAADLVMLDPEPPGEDG